MDTCEETSKSQLAEIRNATAQISSLPVKTIQLRKLSQEQHVQRMLKARNRGETPSAVFVMPFSSPVKEPKRTASPPKPVSPNKTAIKEEDKQVKPKALIKFKVFDEDEKVLKICKPDKIVLKLKDDKISAKNGKQTETKKSKMKSTLPIGKYSKQDKSQRITGNQSPKYAMRKDKILNKKSPKKDLLFHIPHSPQNTTELGKGDSNALQSDCKHINSPEQISPNENEEPKKLEENTYDRAASNTEQSNREIEINVVETKGENEQYKKTINASEGSQTLKRPLKKKKNGIPRFKPKPVKSSQKEKKMREVKSNDQLSSGNKSSKPIKFLDPNRMFSTTVKKDSLLSRSISLDSLDDSQKSLMGDISPVPQTIDKVLNFINDKKDQMVSTSLENDSQIIKGGDNSSKPVLNSNGLARASKIPFHEFRKRQTRFCGKDTDIVETRRDNCKTKDKDFNVHGYNEDTSDISPIVNPFKSEKSIVKSWLKTIPDATQKKEKTGKKARELIPNSINFITANSIVDTGNEIISENNVSDFCETGKNISPTRKSFNFSLVNKALECEEPVRAAMPSTVSDSLSSSAQIVSEMEEGNLFGTLKNAFCTPPKKSPNFKFATPNKDFLMNPIEKFMNEINFAMNDLDSEDKITES